MRLEAWLLAPVLTGCASIQSISRPPPTSEQCEVRRVGGPGDDGASEGLVLDASGGGAVTGFFSETVDLGGGPTHSQGGTDVFVTRFGPSDEPLWTRSLGAASDPERCAGARHAQGRAWVSGHFKESLTVGESVLRSQGKNDVWLGSFSSDGHPLAVRSFGGPGSEYGYAIAVSPRGEVVVSGQFNEQLRACGRTLTSAGRSDAFRARVTLPLSGQD